MAVDNSFVVEKTCPICGQETRVIKTRSRLVVEKRDEDLCVHYKGFNPYFYRIWICEHCGFAADETTFTSPMPNKHREKLREFLKSKDLDIEFTEIRTLPDAVGSFIMALVYLDVINGPASKKGSYNLNVAWLYRELPEYIEEENKYLELAAEQFDESLAKERYPIGGLSDMAAIYLIGAIYYRLGNVEKCTQYLSKIISDQEIRTREPKVFDKARDLWGDIRAGKKKAAPKKK